MSIIRSPQLLNDVINGINVPNNFAFLPHKRLIPAPQGTPGAITIFGSTWIVTDLLTLCNCYVNAVTTALGCPIPPLKANDQIEKYLQANEGKLAGWTWIDKPTAILRANMGYPVVAGAVNPKGHGHIGVGAPEPIVPGSSQPLGHDLFVSAAGISNYARVKYEISFGPLAASGLFFTHD